MLFFVHAAFGCSRILKITVGGARRIAASASRCRDGLYERPHTAPVFTGFGGAAEQATTTSVLARVRATGRPMLRSRRTQDHFEHFWARLYTALHPRQAPWPRWSGHGIRATSPAMGSGGDQAQRLVPALPDPTSSLTCALWNLFHHLHQVFTRHGPRVPRAPDPPPRCCC